MPESRTPWNMADETHAGLVSTIPRFRQLAKHGGPFEHKPKVLLEGDSWFSYPRKILIGIGEPRNLAKCLHKKTRRRWLLCRLSRNGEELRGMFDFHPNQVAGKSKKKAEEIWRKSHTGFLVRQVANNHFDHFLLSAGGNDIVHKECRKDGTAHQEGVRRFLKDTPVPGNARACLKMSVVKEEMKLMGEHLLELVRAALVQRKNPQMRVSIHTYALPFPDGRPFAPGKAYQQGPWFGCAFEEVGIGQSTALAREVVKVLLEEWVTQLGRVRQELPAALREDFVIIDTFHAVALQKKHWNDEMHLTEAGYAKVFDEVWKSLNS